LISRRTGVTSCREWRGETGERLLPVRALILQLSGGSKRRGKRGGWWLKEATRHDEPWYP